MISLVMNSAGRTLRQQKLPQRGCRRGDIIDRAAIRIAVPLEVSFFFLHCPSRHSIYD